MAKSTCVQWRKLGFFPSKKPMSRAENNGVGFFSGDDHIRSDISGNVTAKGTAAQLIIYKLSRYLGFFLLPDFLILSIYI
nr:hypothetical protein Iba_chr12aCG0810 [Ipomoea batatas]GME18347.1 hypothetical protein Iba_scaffold20445CG0030 [Ipomoea batatas]